MKQDSCGPNRIRWGNSCIHDKLPNLGSNLVPSVENKAGCDYINGFWDKKHNICIWSLHSSGGWTAPIKGVYFSWMHGPSVSLKHHKMPKNIPYDKWDDYFSKLPKMAEIKACHVYGDPFYGSIGGSGIGGGGFCHHWLINQTVLGSNGGRETLVMAEKIKNGKGHEIGLGYFTKEGKPTSHLSRDAVASDNANTVRMIYNNLNLEKQAPFSFRFRSKK